ncbi:hypothetical protein BDZ89DRAFT_1162710 [Hymenopellis radicata]|nr:hypothetical protein BDZ89DRAFT_1162710 [Hymenopellis radicata]
MNSEPHPPILDLAVTIGEFDDEIDVSDREQIETIVKSLEVIPAKTVTFLPLLSSLDIQIRNPCNSYDLQCFGPVGSFASMLKARWKGDDTVSLARLRTCHFAVHARHVGRNWENIFTDTERLVFDALVDDGMDLTIQVESTLTESVGDSGMVFAVSR